MADLYERAWPVPDAKGAVVIVHGLAEHTGRYEHVALALNEAGYAVHAQDQRGHGHSPGAPGDMGGDLDAVVGDIVSFCVRTASEYEKTFLLAHSMGSLLSLSAVPEVPSGTLSGLVLSGTALLPGPAALDSLGSGKGIPPEYLSRDPAVVQAYRDDPLVFYDRVPPETMATLMTATQRAGAAIPMIHIPVLVLHGVDDQICSLEGANYVHVQLVGTDKTLKGYRGLYHEILNEPERGEVLADIVGWLDAH